MKVTYHLDFSDERSYYLEACARIRETSVTQLVQRLVNTVCDDHLVLSVLDDGSKPQQGARKFRRSTMNGEYFPP